MGFKPGIFLAGLLHAALGCAVSDAATAPQHKDFEQIKSELHSLIDGQAALRKELAELTAIVKAKPASPPAVPLAAEAQIADLDVANLPFLGRKDAELVVVEFYDYDCPFCARHVQQTFPQLDHDYIQSGKLKYVVKDYPIDSLHPTSFVRHEAARCAGDQGHFWEMREHFLGKDKEASAGGDYSETATALGLHVDDFKKCMASKKHAAEVRADSADGSRAGVTGTPTFFLGTVEPGKSHLQVLRVIRGAQPYQTFKDAIDAALNTPVGKKS